MNAARKTTQAGLSTAGKAFFGSLCAGTFGLGCWQTQRYFEKIELVAERREQLSLEPSTDINSLREGNGYRPVKMNGRYHYDKEILVGPRTAPPGTLPDKPGSSSSGMSSGPQGYFVLTPFKTKDNKTILVNRGWVPRHFGTTDTNLRRGKRPSAAQPPASPQYLNWERPSGSVSVTAVRASVEEPKYLVAEHMLDQSPPVLYWFDEKTLQSLVSELPVPSDLLYVTEVRADNMPDEELEWPLSPPVGNVGDFKTTPEVHLGYLATWYGLSAAGVYMTRKLLKRGR